MMECRSDVHCIPACETRGEFVAELDLDEVLVVVGVFGDIGELVGDGDVLCELQPSVDPKSPLLRALCRDLPLR
jgi:hypothetical protein